MRGWWSSWTGTGQGTAARVREFFISAHEKHFRLWFPSGNLHRRYRRTNGANSSHLAFRVLQTPLWVTPWEGFTGTPQTPNFGCCCSCAALKWHQTLTLGEERVSKQDHLQFSLDFQPADMGSNISTSRVPGSQPFLLTLPFPALLQGRISEQPYQPAFPPPFSWVLFCCLCCHFFFSFFFVEHIR